MNIRVVVFLGFLVLITINAYSWKYVKYDSKFWRVKPNTPPGWKNQFQLRGDFNHDGKMDYAYICSDGIKQMLIIAEGRGKGKYSFVIVESLLVKNIKEYYGSIYVNEKIHGRGFELLYMNGELSWGPHASNDFLGTYRWNKKTKTYDEIAFEDSDM